jgi:hypothetical protein
MASHNPTNALVVPVEISCVYDTEFESFIVAPLSVKPAISVPITMSPFVGADANDTTPLLTHAGVFANVGFA